MNTRSPAVRAGIVGCGKITQVRHAPEYADNPRAEIAGFCDVNQERAALLARQYGAKAYASYEEMLRDESVTAVSVCSPNSTHAENTIRALRAGKHVLCEKPMALSVEEGRAMLKAEKETGKKLMLGLNQRLLPTHVKARALLREGAIGKVLFCQASFKHKGPESWSITNNNTTWFFDKRQAHFGVLGDLGAHKLDILRCLTGDEIEEVLCSAMTLDKRYDTGELIDLDDNAVCLLRTRGGIPGIMHVSWTNYGGEDNSTVIYGDKGVMKIFGDFSEDIVLEMRDGTTVKYTVGRISTNDRQLKSGVIDAFVNCIADDTPPAVTSMDGYCTLAVIQSAMRSQETGGWVKVEY